MPEIVIYLQSDDLERMAEELTEKLAPKAEDLALLAEKLEDLDKNKMIALEEFAKMAATSNLEYYLYNIFLLEVQKACFSTVEYNYDLYVERLLEAIDANWDDVIYFEGTEYSPRIRIDFSPLGDPQMWMDAVESVRGTREFGKGDDMEARSRMWAEKIYKTAREGRKLTRKKYRKNKESGEMEVSKEYDITERYKGKYRETIAARLAEIPSDKAPFWYFIEFGNASYGGEGEPYPKLPRPPTPMSRAIEIQIDNLYYELYDKFYSEGFDYIATLTDNSTYENLASDDLENFHSEEETTDEYEETVRYLFEFIEDEYEVFKVQGRAQVAKRGAGGRFQKLPDEVKRLSQEAKRKARRG